MMEDRRKHNNKGEKECEIGRKTESNIEKQQNRHTKKNVHTDLKNKNAESKKKRRTAHRANNENRSFIRN